MEMRTTMATFAGTVEVNHRPAISAIRIHASDLLPLPVECKQSTLNFRLRTARPA